MDVVSRSRTYGKLIFASENSAQQKEITPSEYSLNYIIDHVLFFVHSPFLSDALSCFYVGDLYPDVYIDMHFNKDNSSVHAHQLHSRSYHQKMKVLNGD